MPGSGKIWKSAAVFPEAENVCKRIETVRYTVHHFEMLKPFLLLLCKVPKDRTV